MFGVTDILTRENLRQMDKILTNKDDNDIEAVLKAKEFYQLCLNANFSGVLGPQSLLKFLNVTGKEGNLVPRPPSQTLSRSRGEKSSVR